MPKTVGFYWAKWRIASDETRDGDELTPSNEWEIVRVHLNTLNKNDPDHFKVSVAGIEQTQHLEDFFWGPGPIKINL